MVVGSPHAAHGVAVTRPAHGELAEHVATYAAERGDTELEQLCDDVLAGLTEESLLLAVVGGDPDLQEAVERGRNAGWRSRRVQDAFERATVAITGRSYAEVAADTAPAPTSDRQCSTYVDRFGHRHTIHAHPGDGRACTPAIITPDAEVSAETEPAPHRSFADVLSSPAFGRLIRDHLDAQAERTERWSRWILGDAEYEAMRARLDNPPSERQCSAPVSAARTGIHRMRERLHRIRYNRERRMAIEADEDSPYDHPDGLSYGVSWPVDLGEAG